MPTSTLRRLLTLAAALCVLSLSPTAFAQDPQLAIGARTTSAPFTFAWVDTAEGLRLDEQRARDVAAQFSDTDWAFFDNSQLVIGKNAQPLVGVFYAASEDLSFFLLHRREKSFQMDGKVIRDPQTRQGFADLYITTVAEDGQSSSTVFLQVPLNFTR